MDLFRESRYIIILLCWLGWLCGLAFGQLSEAFTGSTNVTDIAITCIGYLAAFVVTILEGQAWVEEAVKRAVVIRRGKNLNEINGVVDGWTTSAPEKLSTCSVVMLCPVRPFYPLTRMMLYLSSVHSVESILLQSRPIGSVKEVSEDIRTCRCSDREERCRCTVFKTVDDIKIMLARRLPGTLKKLHDSLCLLPAPCCLRNGCHGSRILHVENDIIREAGESEVESPVAESSAVENDIEAGESEVESPVAESSAVENDMEAGDSEVESPVAESSTAVCELLDCESIHKGRTCICIPVRSTKDDDWTNELIKILKPHPKEFRGSVIREKVTSASSALENYKRGITGASSALKNYKNGSGDCDAVETYNFFSLMIVPKLIQVLITNVLTFWFKVDGFSSFVFAMRAVKDYKLYDSRFLSTGESSSYKFLTKVYVKSDANNTNVCQVLFFRNRFQVLVFLNIIQFWVGCICSVCWMILFKWEGGWYHTHSMPLNTGRILVIVAGVGIVVVMDTIDLKLYLKIREINGFRGSNLLCVTIVVVCALVALEIDVIVSMKHGNRAVYALALLVWTKFLIGLQLSRETVCHLVKQDLLREATWWYGSCGQYIFASSFFLNAILVGVRAKWEFY